MRLIVLLVCIWIPFVAIAQRPPCDIVLSGRVVDEEHEDPLSFATVVIDSAQIVAVCDENGRFSVAGVCPGTHTVFITHVGCDPTYFRVELTENTFREFRLDHTLEDLGHIEVHGSATLSRGTMTQTTIEGADIDRITGKSLGNALKDVNGLNALQTGTSISKPVIHGLHSNRILIMNNGVRQEGQQWGNEHGPEIDPFVAESFTVIKGASAVKYGSDALGGVILVDPAPLPDTNGLRGTLHTVGFSNTRGGAIAGMIEQMHPRLPYFSYRLQGSVMREGNTQTPDYYLANTANGTRSFSTTAGWHKQDWRTEVYYSRYDATVGIFSGSHIGNLTDLENAFASDTPLVHQDFTYTIGRPYQKITHHLIKGLLDHHSEKFGSMLLTVAYQDDYRSEYDADAPLNDSLAALDLPSLYFELGTLTVDGEYQRHPGKKFNGIIGFNGMNQQNVTRYSTFIPNFRSYSGGVYAIERYRSGGWMVEVGGRYDYRWMRIFRYVDEQLDTPEHVFGNLSASAGLQYFNGQHTQYNVNLSTAWRAPTVSELYSEGLHHGAASLEYGNDSLKAERSYQAVFSLEHNSDKWFIDFGVYNNYMRDFIYLQPTLPAELTIRGAFPVFHYRQTDANLLGTDLQVRYRLIDPLEIECKTSLLRARDLVRDTWIVMMPADKVSASVRYAFGDAKNVSNVHASMEWTHVFKQTRVEALEDYVPPPAAYSLLGAMVEGDWRAGKTLIHWGVEGDNLLNTPYRDYLNRFRYFADDMGMNITLRLKIPLFIND